MEDEQVGNTGILFTIYALLYSLTAASAVITVIMRILLFSGVDESIAFGISSLALPLSIPFYIYYFKEAIRKYKWLSILMGAFITLSYALMAGLGIIGAAGAENLMVGIGFGSFIFLALTYFSYKIHHKRLKRLGFI
ncbi:Uncharacterised protein [Oligella urethralis]|uniref:hypothetical protein n=1 Tax=Oligella urethralis TaxID=90245 RepID=UPI000E077B32|nr:hypothetical protein [Oligella urethralis]SUA61670.1 Uncharacterised protein [Oligella urethralis]